MSLTQRIDAILSEAAANGAVPGVVAGVTSAGDDLYLGGFGERVLGGGDAMTPDTVGWIASMTKAVTGAAAMQLVEQGRLDLDAPAASVIPHLDEVPVLEGFDDDGKPRTRPPRRAITLRHLLTHTAGFSYEIWSDAIVRYQEATGTPGVMSCENAALTTPLLFDPGDRWDYGINIDWAGKMVEAVSGHRLDDRGGADYSDSRGTSATALIGAPEPPSIFIGSANTVKPLGGSWSRPVRFSRAPTLLAAASTWTAKFRDGPWSIDAVSMPRTATPLCSTSSRAAATP